MRTNLQYKECCYFWVICPKKQRSLIKRHEESWSPRFTSRTITCERRWEAWHNASRLGSGTSNLKDICRCRNVAKRHIGSCMKSWLSTCLWPRVDVYLMLSKRSVSGGLVLVSKSIFFLYRSVFAMNAPPNGGGFAQHHYHLPRCRRWCYTSNPCYSPDSSYWCSYSKYQMHEDCTLLRCGTRAIFALGPSSAMPRSRQNLYIEGCHFSCGPWLWSSVDENKIECPNRPTAPFFFLNDYSIYTCSFPTLFGFPQIRNTSIWCNNDQYDVIMIRIDTYNITWYNIIYMI